MAVKDVFLKNSIVVVSIELGEVEIEEDLTTSYKTQLGIDLNALGFELIDDKKSLLIEKIKNAVIQIIHHSEELPKGNFSDYISSQLNHDYNYLSNLFSEIEGTTIEKYLIAQKVEKVKELLKYDQLSLTQISDKLGYSSVAYLSNQFKKTTGLTPSFYKNKQGNLRKNLDEL